jgi:hypothetical protein
LIALGLATVVAVLMVACKDCGKAHLNY